MVNKIQMFIRRISIKQRLFVFVLLPTILMLVCFLFYYSFSMNMMFYKNEQASKQLVNMAEENLSLNVQRLEENISEVRHSYLFQEILKDTKEDEKQEQAIEKLRTTLNSNQICIYDKNKQFVYMQGVGNVSSCFLDSLYQWSFDPMQQKIYYSTTLIQDGNEIGYLRVSFDKEIFAPWFANTRSDTAALLILDENNRVLFGQGNFQFHTLVEVEDGKTEINHKTYYINVQPVEGLEWKIADLVTKEYVYEEIHNFRNMILLYCVIALIVLLIFSSITYHSIHDPIDHILKAMNNFHEDDVQAVRIQDEGKDELHNLGETFNDLVKRIDELLITVQREQEQKRETQIQLLQAQINPHFLFNTLNTLKYLAILNEDKPVSEGINALAKLLRNTIVDSTEMVRVEEEIENVKNYIIIQKLRYGDLFETVYNIDEDVKHCKILKFLLQPIVENSILHAFEEDREHQILTIRAKTWKGCLRIEIGDNGKGFYMNDSVNSNKKLSSIGIQNIQERIQLMYGDAYTMQVESEINVGTITTLLLPLQN